MFTTQFRNEGLIKKIYYELGVEKIESPKKSPHFTVVLKLN